MRFLSSLLVSSFSSLSLCVLSLLQRMSRDLTPRNQSNFCHLPLPPPLFFSCSYGPIAFLCRCHSTTHTQAEVIVWDLDAHEVGKDPIKYRFNAHKVKVQGLSFSPSGTTLATLGGSDDNKLALWRMDTGRMIMTTEAGNDSALCVSFASQDDCTLVTGG